MFHVDMQVPGWFWVALAATAVLWLTTGAALVWHWSREGR